MSRIFDALQRSENERSGSNPPKLPDGRELLKRAEDHASTGWGDTAAVEELSSAPSREEPISSVLANLAHDSSNGSQNHVADVLPSSEPVDVFRGFKPKPITLSAQSRLVCLTDRESPTAEALRLLGVRLRDLRRQKPLKKVLITSTIPQEGKSTIASNLACTLSHATQEKTLLLEGDLRRPSLARLFGISAGPGLCDCLRDDTKMLQGIYHLEEAGLWIWPSGKSPQNPLELLQSPKLSGLMNQLSMYFDWVIIDSPPILPLADTSVWMRLADGILLVTREGTTEKKQLKSGLEALDSNKVLGAIVNGAVPSAYSGYYYRGTHSE